MTILPEARQLWAHWIAPEHTTDEALAALAAWFRSRPRTPCRVDGFLHPEKAARLAEALEAVPRWEACHAVLDDGKLRDLPEAEWRALPPAARWSRQHLAPSLQALLGPEGLPPADRAALGEFVLFSLVGPALRSWITAFTDVPLQRTVTCEIVRYEEEDFIASHSDTHDDRILGLNVYLGDGGAPETGGLLGYRGEDGRETLLAPRFNSLSLLPIHPACAHWVTPWRAATPGRLTFCMSVRPA